MISTPDHLFDRVQEGVAQAPPTPLLLHGKAFHVTATQGGVLAIKATLDYGRVGDQSPAVDDDRVHPAEGVLPVGFGELPGVGRDQHPVGVVHGLAIQVAGVD